MQVGYQIARTWQLYIPWWISGQYFNTGTANSVEVAIVSQYSFKQEMTKWPSVYSRSCCGSGHTKEIESTESRYAYQRHRAFWIEANSSAMISGGEMQMTFTTTFNGASILFDQWAPKSTGTFVGSLFVIALAAFIMRMLIFVRAHLCATRWNKREYRVSLPWSCGNVYLQGVKMQPFYFWIEIQRMLLAFVMAILGYSLMLIAMTYVVVCISKLSKLIQGLLPGGLWWTSYWGICIWPVLHTFVWKQPLQLTRIIILTYGPSNARLSVNLRILNRSWHQVTVMISPNSIPFERYRNSNSHVNQ